MPRPPEQTLDILRTEIAALRLANTALEQRMLLEAEHTDTMLRELETQRDALRVAHKTQKHLGSFIQRVMDSAGSLLIVLTPDGYVRMSNQPCEEALGISTEALHGTILDDRLPAEERAALAEKLPALPWPVHSTLFELISYHGSYSGEHQLRCGDGSYRRYLFDAEALHSPQGKQEGAVINATDITELKEQEGRLRRSEFLLKEAQQYALMGSWELDLASKTLSWSEEAYRIFEIDRSLAADPYHDFFAAIHPDDRARVEQTFADSLRKRQPLDVTHRILVDGHHLKWVHQRGSHRYTISGRPLRSVGTVQDITERHQVEQQLRVAATAFEAQEGMVITDVNGTILRINRSFSEITGYSAEELVGQTPRLLNSGRQDADFYTAMWTSLANTGVWQGEIWNRRKNGEIYPEWLTITAVKDDAGKFSNYVGTITDITLRKTAENEIRDLAFYDPLTRLPNRRLLMDRLQQAITSSARTGHWGALLFIDLDNFKTLNDTLGHDKGDLLLQQVAQRLLTCVRESDTVARLGGDEFVVILEELSTNPLEAGSQTKNVGEKILSTLNQTYQLADHQHQSTPSIGITLFSEHQETIDELLKRADLSMYEAKAAGRNTLRFFDPEMQAVVTVRAELESALREALQKEQFILHYQAQFENDDRLTGAEVLIRWQHPERGMVPPNDFIPLAEETGLILPIGQWVLETACRQLACWATRPEMARLKISVNVSAHQFHQVDFVAQVLALIERTGANPQRLKMELTESVLVTNAEDIITKMNALKARGIGFSLDDFGTGYSSLAYLKRLPLDQLKIDRTFVRDVLTDPNDAVIAKMVIALSESMGLSVIAEGVESEAQKDFLAAQGCHAYQGYLFSRPLPLAAFEDFSSRCDVGNDRFRTHGLLLS